MHLKVWLLTAVGEGAGFSEHLVATLAPSLIGLYTTARCVPCVRCILLLWWYVSGM